MTSLSKGLDFCIEIRHWFVVNYKEDMEDAEDLLCGIIAEARKDEEKIPLEIVIENLKKAGKLR